MLNEPLVRWCQIVRVQTQTQLLDATPGQPDYIFALVITNYEYVHFES
jgi:hypothetical protein